ALEKGEIFVPEQGSWQVWWSEDPFLEHPLLRLEAYSDPSAFEEVRLRPGAPEQRSATEVPEPVADLIGKVLGLPCGDGRPLRMDHLEPKAETLRGAAAL